MLFHLSFWIKEKLVATLANRNICDKTQNPQVSSSTVSQNWQLCWEIYKSGVTLGLDHIYLLTLFDLYALHYGSLFGFESSTWIWDTLEVSSNTFGNCVGYTDMV